jgi:hypothetical protein
VGEEFTAGAKTSAQPRGAMRLQISQRMPGQHSTTPVMWPSDGTTRLGSGIAARDKQVDSSKVKAHAGAGAQIAIPLKIKPIHEDFRRTERASARADRQSEPTTLDYEQSWNGEFLHLGRIA